MNLPAPKIEGTTSPEQIQQEVAKSIENHLSQAGVSSPEPVIPVTADTQVDLSGNTISVVTTKQKTPQPPKKENPITELWLNHIKPWFYPIARQTKSKKFLEMGISRQVEKVEN